MLAARAVRTHVVGRNMSSMVAATEMMPHAVDVTPKVSGAAVHKESKTVSGIRVITNDNGAASVGITFGFVGGARAESAAERGFSRVLAATAFNGSAHRTPLCMIRDLELTGATFSAHADKESVRFSVQCTDDVVEDCVATVAEHLCAPINADKYYYVAENSGAATLGAAAHAASGTAQVHDLLHEAAYGAGALASSAVSSGKADTCDIMAFRGRHFTAGNLVVTATGINHEALRALLDQHVSLPDGAAQIAAASPYQGGEARARSDCDHAHAAVGFPVPAGAAAAPYQVLVHKLQAAGFDAFHHQYSDGGLFGVHARGDAAATSATLGDAVAALKAAGASSPGDHKATALASLDAPNADNLMFSAAITGVALGAAAKVSAADVASAAKAALAAQPSYAVYGATAGAASYADIQAMCK